MYSMQAELVVDGALRARKEQGLLPLVIAVVDSGGNVVILKREDGCGIVRSQIAIGKAYAALGMGISSREIRDRLKDRPAFQGAIASASGGRFQFASNSLNVPTGRLLVMLIELLWSGRKGPPCRLRTAGFFFGSSQPDRSGSISSTSRPLVALVKLM